MTSCCKRHWEPQVTSGPGLANGKSVHRKCTQAHQVQQGAFAVTESGVAHVLSIHLPATRYMSLRVTLL